MRYLGSCDRRQINDSNKKKTHEIGLEEISQNQSCKMPVKINDLSFLSLRMTFYLETQKSDNFFRRFEKKCFAPLCSLDYELLVGFCYF